MLQQVPIREQSIRLGQLLKLAGVIDSGSEAKSLLAEHPALVREVERLLRIYGANGSFSGYAGHLLRFLSLGGGPRRYLSAPPE